MKLPVACRRPLWTSNAVMVAVGLCGSLLMPISFYGSGATLHAAEPPASTTGTALPGNLPQVRPKKSNLLEGLSGAELQQAIDGLKQHYFRPSDLGPEELQRALLEGILDRISPGAVLLDAEAPSVAEDQPFKTEILKETIAYLRLGSLKRENLQALETALKERPATSSIILDLRTTPSSNDFQLAGELLGRFCPAGKGFFTLKGPAGTQEVSRSPSEIKPASFGLLVVLIDGENAGASEVIPAVLRLNAKAILIGEATKGRGLVFSDFKVGSNAILRVAVSEVVLADGTRIDSKGVAPDLKVEMSREVKQKVLAREKEQGVGALVFETERPRMNEASLVAGTNPEMDAYQNAQKNGKSSQQEAPLRDGVLQRAVDLITTITVYGKGRN